MLPFVRIWRLKWIGHVNRMGSKRKVSKVFNNNPQGSRLRGRPKHRWWNCVQTDIKKWKITNWKERFKNMAHLEKSINEAKVRIGLKCNRRRRKERKKERKKVGGYRCHNSSEPKFISVYPCASLMTGHRNLLTLLYGLLHCFYLYSYTQPLINFMSLSAAIWLCYIAFFCSMLNCFFSLSIHRIATQCLAHENNHRELTNRKQRLPWQPGCDTTLNHVKCVT